MKKNTKHHKPYPGLKGHCKTYLNHSLKSFEKHLNSSKLSNWQKDQFMTTHCLIINYLKATFRNDPEEMTRIMMNTRISQLKKIKQSNIENNPSHYSEDELCGDHEWNNDW